MSSPVGFRRPTFKTRLRSEVSLARYSTFQIGGPARYFAEPATPEELQSLLEVRGQEGWPLLVVGKGSNLLFPDEGFPGLVVTSLHFESHRIEVDRDRHRIKASSGVNLYRLALAARDQGLSGIEFLSHIPGTLGGALVMNAGFSRFSGEGKEIKDCLVEAAALTPEGEIRRLRREEMVFGYRKSSLDGFFLLEATLQLRPGRPEDIHREIQANFEYRNRVQDLRYPSGGSVFKNPVCRDEAPLTPGDSAGRLIERVGLKGKRIGGAMISDRHANFIVNVGGAKASDVRQLVSLVKKKVFESFGIFLEPEIRIVEI